MKILSTPDCELLHNLFEYEKGKGQLIRKVKTNNRVNIGDIVGTLNSAGYLRVGIEGKSYLVHRIIWKMAYKKDPEQIDHIDGNTVNNKLENLRSVTNQENGKNIKIPSTNNSGHIGVYWSKAKNKWVSNITINGKTIYLGIYNEKSKAILARKDAEQLYKFHKNHGRSI